MKNVDTVEFILVNLFFFDGMLKLGEGIPRFLPVFEITTLKYRFFFFCKLHGQLI